MTEERKNFYNTEGTGWVGMEDTTCTVVCDCGYGLNEASLFVTDHKITRCPKCGRGYKSELIVWQYEKDEE